jgi:hypothetical protein
VLLDESLRREYDRWRGTPAQPLWDTADRPVSPPRRPAAAPFRASPRPPPPFVEKAAEQAQPDPLEEEAQGIAREILLIAGLVALVLCLGLVAVSLLLP